MLYDDDMLPVPGDGVHPAERVSAVDVSHSAFTILGIRPAARACPHRRRRAAERPAGRRALARVLATAIRRRSSHRRPADSPGGRHQRRPSSACLRRARTFSTRRRTSGCRITSIRTLAPINNHTHHAIGLLKPGVTVEAAAADIKRLQDRFAADHPTRTTRGFIEKTGFAMHVTSLRDHVIGETIVRALWLLFAAVGLVLLIAAANVANLFLVRIDARRREVAVRTALGAGRAHLAVYYLSESVLLALAAAAGAVALGAGLLHVALLIAPQTLPRLAEVALDWRSVAFCVATAAAFGILFGIAPAWIGERRCRDAARCGPRSHDVASPRARAAGTRVVAGWTRGRAALRCGAGDEELRATRARAARVRSGRRRVDGRDSAEHAVSLVSRSRALLARVDSSASEALPGVVRAGATEALPLADRLRVHVAFTPT